jgi:hypothetical protein
MPDLVRPNAGTVPSDDLQHAARDRLRQALDAQRDEKERFDYLYAAKERLADDLRRAHGKLADARDALHASRTTAPLETVYAYAAGEELRHRQSIAEGEALVQRRQNELDALNDVDHGLDHELSAVEARLRTRTAMVQAALAQVIETSPEFAALCTEIQKTWQRLRTLKVTGDHILTACHGNLSASAYRAIQSAEPLELRVGYDLDDSGYFDRWQNALARLLENPDTALPAGDV